MPGWPFFIVTMPRQGFRMKKKAKLMGAHWEESGESKLYQLYRRVEDVAGDLEQRRQGGWVPTKKYIEELYDIAIQLKVLDTEVES